MGFSAQAPRFHTDFCCAVFAVAQQRKKFLEGYI